MFKAFGDIIFRWTLRWLLARVYEIIEAVVASLINPDSGESFVSMQGDIWDAQKDIALAGIGAALMMTIVAVSRAYRAAPEFARPPAELTVRSLVQRCGARLRC